MRAGHLAALLAGAILVAAASPAGARVAAYGGYRGGAAVAPRPGCCTTGDVGRAFVAGAVVGAAAASQPGYYDPGAVYYAPEPAASGPSGPPPGTTVYSLPAGGGCNSMPCGGTDCMKCNDGATYQPFYSGGALMYKVVTP